MVIKSEVLLLEANSLDAYSIAMNRISAMEVKKKTAHEDYWADEWALAGFKPYTVEDSTLVIPVEGALVGDFDLFFFGVFTGYDYIKKAYDRGMEDPEVKKIRLEIRSGGGQVYSLFELISYMKTNKKKPVTSVCMGLTCSAAYALATVADEIVSKPSSIVGSIGCLIVHANISKQLQDNGIEVTVIRHGNRKAETNPFETLSEEAKKTLDTEVKKVYDDFVLMVSEARGIDPEKIYGLESRTLLGAEALEYNLVDRLEGFINNKRNNEQEKLTMSTANSSMEMEAETAAKIKTATMEAVKMEQARIASILTECSDYPKTAMLIASLTELNSSQVKELIASFESETKKEEVKATPFEKAMKTGNPEIEANDDMSGEGNSKLAEILKNSGLKIKQK